MSASDRDAIERLTDTIFATVGEPVRAASLFYALYYLVEVEGASEAAFDFKQLRERQARGFYWYGIVSITKEMSHIHDRYFIEGKAGELDDTEPDPAIADHIEEDLFPDNRDRQLDAIDVYRTVPGAFFDVTREPLEVTAGLRSLNAEFDVLADPARYIRILRDMFEAMPAEAAGPDVMRSRKLTGWPIGYDGPAWVGVCEHLLRRDGLSDTAFVDTSWSIEHNNSRWIDKIAFQLDPTENAAIVEELGLSRFDDPRSQTVRPGEALGAVTDILDAARDGPTSRLFDWAVHFDRDVPSVNLRRMRQRLNL